jgi:hypothetical protein
MDLIFDCHCNHPEISGHFPSRGHPPSLASVSSEEVCASPLSWDEAGIDGASCKRSCASWPARVEYNYYHPEPQAIFPRAPLTQCPEESHTTFWRWWAVPSSFHVYRFTVQNYYYCNVRRTNLYLSLWRDTIISVWFLVFLRAIKMMTNLVHMYFETSIFHCRASELRFKYINCWSH